MVGSLRYLADTTDYSLAYITGVLARSLQEPTARHHQAAKRAIRYVKSRRDEGITYWSDSHNPGTCTLEAYVDSDWAQCPDSRKSTTGLVFTYAGSPIHWCSKKQKTVAQSSSEAEYIAAAHAARDLAWLQQLASGWGINLLADSYDPADLNLTANPQHLLQVDNLGAIAMAHATGPTRRTKHIDVKHHYIQQQVRKRSLRLTPIDTKLQKADMFTKPLKRTEFLRHSALLQHAAPAIEGGCHTPTHKTSDHSNADSCHNTHTPLTN